MDYNVLIGAQIKRLRTEKNYTLQQLSDQSGLSIGFLSQLERGLSSIAIDSLGKLAKILGTDLGSFFHKPYRDTDSPVMRSYEKECFLVSNEIIQYVLVNNVENFHLLPRLFELLPYRSTQKPDPGMYHHDGEEFIYVIEGVLTVYYNGAEYNLYPGDSIILHSFLDHNWVNLTNRVVRFVSVNTPNPYKNKDSKNKN